MKFLGIIPARYASTRFPAKPLAVLGGKTVIQRVYEQVAGILDDAYVATDDERIEAAVKAFGGKVVMTSTEHKSGTDRCQEACNCEGWMKGSSPWIFTTTSNCPPILAVPSFPTSAMRRRKTGWRTIRIISISAFMPIA